MSSDLEDYASSDNDDADQKEQQRPNKRSKVASTPLEVAPEASSKDKSINAVTYNSGQICKQPNIILLDQATLETIKNKRGLYELLNCDDHREICRKKLKKDPNEFRPDILHQEILAILDSPLNKAGLVKIYIQTKKNILIDVNPSIRIPRTYKRFSGLMIQLLHKMKIKAGTESTTLLKVIKNPFSQYLPPGTTCYGMSCKGKLYSPISLAKSVLPESVPTPAGSKLPVCFIIGAMSSGHITMNDHPYITEMFSISEYPLSGAAALSRVATGIEHHWGIV
jgi:rRNA small subunit pseudouridine methyltransferase Nep1